MFPERKFLVSKILVIKLFSFDVTHPASRATALEPPEFNFRWRDETAAKLFVVRIIRTYVHAYDEFVNEVTSATTAERGIERDAQFCNREQLPRHRLHDEVSIIPLSVTNANKLPAFMLAGR